MELVVLQQTAAWYWLSSAVKQWVERGQGLIVRGIRCGGHIGDTGREKAAWNPPVRSVVFKVNSARLVSV